MNRKCPYFFDSFWNKIIWQKIRMKHYFEIYRENRLISSTHFRNLIFGRWISVKFQISVKFLWFLNFSILSRRNTLTSHHTPPATVAHQPGAVLADTVSSMTTWSACTWWSGWSMWKPQKFEIYIFFIIFKLFSRLATASTKNFILFNSEPGNPCAHAVALDFSENFAKSWKVEKFGGKTKTILFSFMVLRPNFCQIEKFTKSSRRNMGFQTPGAYEFQKRNFLSVNQ